MEILLVIALLVIGYLVVKSTSRSNSIASSGTASKKSAASKSKATVRNDKRWLEDRWKAAKEQQLSGRSGIFPKWYFDEVTERQLERLEELDVSVNRRKITKGQASDLIGMHEQAEDESLEVLKFFKVPIRGMKQTQARHEVALIFEDEKKVQAWRKRPLSALQKEFYKFFEIKLARGTTHEQATTLINEHESEMSDRDDPRLEEWEACEQIIDELSDPDFREDYEIKKPSSTLIKQAIGELQKDGKSYQDISDDIDILIDKLIELKPELQRG